MRLHITLNIDTARLFNTDRDLDEIISEVNDEIGASLYSAITNGKDPFYRSLNDSKGQQIGWAQLAQREKGKTTA